jgi:hypothetical protein
MSSTASSPSKNNRKKSSNQSSNQGEMKEDKESPKVVVSELERSNALVAFILKDEVPSLFILTFAPSCS